MSKYILGIDIGTSSCKATVFDSKGIAIATATVDYPVYHPAPGWAEQNPNEWWGAVCNAILELFKNRTVNPSNIAAIGIAGQSWSAVAVDKNGDTLFNTPIWMDTRSTDICREMTQNVPPDEIFALCGNPLQPMFTTPKIRWLESQFPDVFKRAYKILQSNSYIVYRLTGKFTQDTSQGYGLHFFDVRKLEWDKNMANALGVSLDLMPEISLPSQIVGAVTPEAAMATGLLSGIPVVAGGLDAACSTLGAGVANPGETQAQGGTAGGMSLCMGNPVSHPLLILSPHVAPERWLLQGGTVGGGGVLRWLRDNVFQGLDYAAMSELAAQSQPGAGGLVFLPYMSGERSPIWDENAKGLFYGLDYSKGKNHIIRSAMEGVAFSLLHNIETAKEAGVSPHSLNLVGGVANSVVWMQILADVTCLPIYAPSADTGTNLGAAMLAGIGVGLYKDAQDAIRQAVRPGAKYEPNAQNHTLYTGGYKVYRQLYDRLKSLTVDIYANS